MMYRGSGIVTIPQKKKFKVSAETQSTTGKIPMTTDSQFICRFVLLPKGVPVANLNHGNFQCKNND